MWVTDVERSWPQYPVPRYTIQSMSWRHFHISTMTKTLRHNETVRQLVSHQEAASCLCPGLDSHQKTCRTKFRFICPSNITAHYSSLRDCAFLGKYLKHRTCMQLLMTSSSLFTVIKWNIQNKSRRPIFSFVSGHSTFSLLFGVIHFTSPGVSTIMTI